MLDIVSLVTWLGGASVVATLIMGVLKALLEKVPERFGALAKLVLLFVISLVVSAGVIAMNLLPDHIIVVSTAVMSGAIGLYEFFYKALYQQAIAGKVSGKKV